MIRRIGPALLFVAGVILAVVLAYNAGVDAIGQALAAVGPWRLALVCVTQVVSLALCAVGWWVVAGGTPLRACLAARWIRDGATNLFGFIPAIGEAISARALSVIGAATAGRATASTVVDVAVEALAQAVYTLVGLALLMPHLNLVQAQHWTIVAGIALLPVLLMFAISRHHGALHFVEKLGEKLAGGILGLKSETGPLNLAETVRKIYLLRGRVAAAGALHLIAWLMSAVQVWIAAAALAHPLGIVDSVALASLVSAARSAFFVVPWAAGVQEGGFLLVGAALGMDASSAIALSLVLRARDVIVGAPAVFLWYAAEGRRRLDRAAAAARAFSGEVDAGSP